jgi:DNA-binding GntR family transcriptional regulator
MEKKIMARLKSDASNIAFTNIKNRINKFDLMPGDTISDLAISEELKMSRTPVREAIFNLIQYNLVEKQKTKFVVKPIPIEDIKEILQLREAIETKACELIIDNGGFSE